MHKSRGFTLIELMVTVAVLAVIAMMAAPSFGNLLQKQNLNRSTQELVGQLNNARSKAVLERRDVKVVLKRNSNPQDPKPADTPGQLNWKPVGSEVLTANSPIEIIFQMSGGVKNYDADIKDKPFKICDKAGGNKSKNISLSLMGTIHMTEGTC